MEIVVLGPQAVPGVRRSVGRRLPTAAASATPPATGHRTDPRYKSRRWKKVRIRVLNRDRWTCQVAPGCTIRGNVCDHVIPVYDGMPDALFFGEGNLRAACRGHNIARGLVPEPAESPDPTPSSVITGDYS